MSAVFALVNKLLSFLRNASLKTYSKIGVLTIIVWFIWKNRARKHETIPMRPGFLPIIGHLHYMLGLMPRPRGVEPLDNMKDVFLALNQDAISSCRFGQWTSVFLLDPNHIKFVFEDQFNDFEKSSAIRDRLYELLGDGIFASDGEIWRSHRKIGSKMFSMRNLKNYMFEVAKRGNDRWMAKIEQLREKDNVVDIYNLLAIYTLDVFVEIAFGESLQIIEAIPAEHPFSVAFDNALNTIAWRFRLPFFNLFRQFGVFHERIIQQNVGEINKFANEMIQSVRRDAAGNMVNASKKGQLADVSGTGKHNILSLFLQENPKLSSTELKDIAMNFIIAGRDTTRILLSWFLYELSLPQNKLIEQRIVKEIEHFYANEKELTYQNIQNHYGDDKSDRKSYFKYLEATLLETLRLHPPVPFLLRFALRDVRLPGPKGYVIKKGEAVIVQQYIQAYNTRIWGDDAAVFKPERFLEKGLKSFEPHIYPTFNIAPRLCLGRHVAIMESKLVAIKLLQKYRFEAVKKRER